MLDANTPIKDIAKIQPAYQKRLAKLGLQTVRDLFYHFPRRYEDLSNIKPIAELKPGEIATAQGQICSIRNIHTRKRGLVLTEAVVRDASGEIKAIWFNQPFIANTLRKNDHISMAGKINLNKALYFSCPSYEKITENEATISSDKLRHTGKLISIYPETAGLSSRYLRYILQFLSPALKSITDWLPTEIQQSQKVINLYQALLQIHFPASLKTIALARQRLAFDELFLIQLHILQQKMRRQKEKAVKLPFNETLIKNFVESLPFKLTDSQRRAAWEILRDIDSDRPMNRLLEGDVGSGKTVVAALAALQTVNAGFQAAIMAPTEILAEQHYKTLQKLFAGANIKIGLATSGRKIINGRENNFSTSAIVENSNIVIGTHSLIQKSVRFKKLALAVIDEQHRFGVAQRAALIDGLPNSVPHLLSMTATPIPRTLALTLYGDLDISLLKELPANRQPVITKIVTDIDRPTAYNFIRQQINQDRQAFVICPRIDTDDSKNLNAAAPRPTLKGKNQTLWPSGNWPESSPGDIKAVKQEMEKLSKKIFPKFKIAALHGQLKSTEKNRIMTDFQTGKIHILISTSVVEVGVDIPNASVMMIEGAEHFGLAQLHQFRGRIGRSRHQSFCFLLTGAADQKNNQRLKAMLTARNGFELAEQDLRLRGPGQFYGARQWGLPDLSMASLTDKELIRQTRREAQKLLQNDPDLQSHFILQKKLRQFQEKIHWE